MYTYLHNSYNIPAPLYLENEVYIMSQKGVTQGDNAAMAINAISIQPLIQLQALKLQTMMWNRYGLQMIGL